MTPPAPQNAALTPLEQLHQGRKIGLHWCSCVNRACAASVDPRYPWIPEIVDTESVDPRSCLYTKFTLFLLMTIFHNATSSNTCLTFPVPWNHPTEVHSPFLPAPLQRMQMNYQHRCKSRKPNMSLRENSALLASCSYSG